VGLLTDDSQSANLLRHAFSSGGGSGRAAKNEFPSATARSHSCLWACGGEHSLGCRDRMARPRTCQVSPCRGPPRHHQALSSRHRRGIHPEPEMTRLLTERGFARHSPVDRRKSCAAAPPARVRRLRLVETFVTPPGKRRALDPHGTACPHHRPGNSGRRREVAADVFSTPGASLVRQRRLGPGRRREMKCTPFSPNASWNPELRAPKSSMRPCGCRVGRRARSPESGIEISPSARKTRNSAAWWLACSGAMTRNSEAHGRISCQGT